MPYACVRYAYGILKQGNNLLTKWFPKAFDDERSANKESMQTCEKIRKHRSHRSLRIAVRATRKQSESLLLTSLRQCGFDAKAESSEGFPFGK